jgi:hypothetical protein
MATPPLSVTDVDCGRAGSGSICTHGGIDVSCRRWLSFLPFTVLTPEVAPPVASDVMSPVLNDSGLVFQDHRM